MVTRADIEKAYQHISNRLVKTPCVFSPYLSEIFKARIFLKLENMQRTGSYKERGALSFLLQRGQHKQPVVAASAGNHAQAVARHAALLGIPATIFMPVCTPNNKIRQTEALGAKIELVGNNYDESFTSALDFSKKNNAEYIHAYDDPFVIAGQGSIALEIIEQVGVPDLIVVPVGGGGLIAGIASAVSHTTKVVGVEAIKYQSMSKAILGQKPSTTSNLSTIAEGIAVKSVGNLTKQICQKFAVEFVSVNDNDIENALMILLERQKIVAEGAGAASVAALFAHRNYVLAQKTIVLIISGGNIDISLLAKIMGRELIKSNRLCRISIVINDTPGSLASLLQSVTKCSANILEIEHERVFTHIRWNEVLVHVTVEIKDENHEQKMISILNEQGFKITTTKLDDNCA